MALEILHNLEYQIPQDIQVLLLPLLLLLRQLQILIFLMAGTDAGIIDKGQSARDLTLFGNTKSSTTQNKFLTSSIYFDGNGDYI